MPIGRTIAVLVFASCAGTGRGQTTQALVAGSVLDRLSGKAIAHASVMYRNETTGANGSASSNSSGYYVLPLLSPGNYRIACSAPGYQPGELWNLDLAVAGRLEVSFRLRPIKDVWGTGQYRSLFFPDSEAVLPFFGPDLDPGRSSSFAAALYSHGFLESSVSTVIDLGLIRNLPLAGRDVYSTLAVNPGVAADTTTGRGLGLSVNGQRPASSNFLLDGVENNNALVTGPLTALAPEMIQEYRVSISAWSAEFGRTSGYLANAITRAGGESWHGTAYFNLKNDAFNANDFERNARGEPRTPFHETQYGFQTGGPVWRKRLFVSAGLEMYRSRSETGAMNVNLPTEFFTSQFSDSNPARLLFERFPTPAAGPSDDYVVNVAVHPTVSIDRTLALTRADYIAGPHRFSLRAAINRTDWPDFIWYPYKDFQSGLEQPAASVVASYTAAMGANVTHEARASFSRATTRWDRAHPEIPTLVITQTLLGPDTTLRDLSEPTLLPGSPALYGFRNTDRTVQLADSWLWTRGRHIAKAGGGLFVRNPDGLMTTGKDGRYSFDSILDFLIDNPATLTAALSRSQLPNFAAPNYDRHYRNIQYFLFAQDTWRASRQLVLNGGIRYENFGAPSNTGAIVDPAAKLGSGRTLEQALAGASLAVGSRTLWGSDYRDFAPRFGFAYDASRWHGPVIRGGYGIYYDRLFDNLWTGTQNNSIVVPPSFDCRLADCTNYLAPVNTVVRQFSKVPFGSDFPGLTLIDPKLRSGLVQSYFLGATQGISENLNFEVNALGSRGRGLLTTDIVNRSGAVINTALPEILWRSNQGSSEHHALIATLRYRPRRGYLQASWTWSHAIDNQSDPLQGEFFNLSIVNFSGREQAQTSAAFSRQFDSSADRGSADFDQRHNVVVFSWFDIPSARGLLSVLTRNWRVAEVAAFRTGFPFSVCRPLDRSHC